MNCILKDATRTDAKGNKTAVEHIFLRGRRSLRFPNMLKKAPMFKRVRDWKRNNSKRRPVQGGQARGQAAAIIRKAQLGSSADADAGGAAPMMWPRSSLVFSLGGLLSRILVVGCSGLADALPTPAGPLVTALRSSSLKITKEAKKPT